MNECCILLEQLEAQDQKVIAAASDLVSYEFRQILVKSRSIHAKAALEKFEAFVDELDIWVDLVRKNEEYA